MELRNRFVPLSEDVCWHVSARNDSICTDCHAIDYPLQLEHLTLGNKATTHQVTTMLATSKNVLFPGHIHLLTTGADGPSF